MLTRKPSFRDTYNPLSGLTLRRLMEMEDAADRGQPADLQWFYARARDTDSLITSAVSRRLSFLDVLQWHIAVDENADPVLAQEQQEFLTYAYNRIQNLKEASKFLAAAAFTGYAHCEKIFSGYGNLISRLEPIEQWYWSRTSKLGPWQFNAEARSDCRKGEPVARRTYCLLEAPALYRSIGRHFYAKSLAMADWDTNLATGANQNIFFVAPEGTTDEKLANFATLAEAVATNGRGALPFKTEIKTLDTAARSRLPYVDRIEYCDKQIVLAATGGILNMLTESGSGTLAGGAHAAALLDLARSDSARLTECFQRDLDLPWLTKFFPRQPKAAYFEFELPQRDDVTAFISNAANLNWIGYRIDQKQLEERTGLRVTPVPTPGAPAA